MNNRLINTTVRTMIAASSAEAPKGGDAGAAVQTTQSTDITIPQTGGKGDPTVPGTPAYEASHLSDGRSMGQVLNNLSKDDLKATYEIADKCYDLQFGAGGIEELQGKLRTLENSVGEQIYKIARIAYVACEGKLIIVASYFKALCRNAEEHLVAKHIEATRAAGNAEELPISKLIPQWSVYKAAVAKGLDMGIDPDQRREGTVTEQNPKGSAKFPTVAKYKAEVEARAKAAGTSENATGSQAGNQRNSQGETGTVTTLVTKGWSKGLAAAMSVMCQELNRLTHEEQDRFADRILQIAADAKTLADAAHKAALTQPVTTVAPEGTETTGEEGEDDLDPGTLAAMQAALDKEKATPVVAGGPKSPASSGSKDKGGKKSRGTRAA